MLDFTLECTSCSRRERPTSWACEACGSPLRIKKERIFDRERIQGARSIWRYRDLIAHVAKEVISLGEGCTPTVRYNERLFLKLEYLNPTGSFKDRGSSVAITTHLALWGRDAVVNEDSSGNAGASMAAYCAKAGIPISVYVAHGASERKLQQIKSYGARVVVVEGSRDMAGQEAMRAPGVYAGHAWNPFFVEGMKTLAYEVAEEFDWRPPENIYVPTAVGTLLLGLCYGFQEMLEAGAIAYMPRLVAVQPRLVSPLYHALKGLAYDPHPNAKSVADAIASHNPPRLKEMVQQLKRWGGDCVALEEDGIVKCSRRLAGMGLFVEAAASLGYGAYLREADRLEGRALVILTGIGLKSPPLYE